MILIFDSFLEGTIDAMESLNEVYANKKSISVKWISSKDMTIQDIINDICDSYEAEGFDLETLPVTKIGDRFHLYEPSYKIPKEYVRLLETKDYVEIQIKEAKLAGYDNSIVSFMEATLDSIIDRIKGLK